MLVLDLLVAHMLGDYVFQNDWMAQHKFTNFWARLIHCSIYTLMFLPIVINYASRSFWVYFSCFALLLFSHMIIDSRRWAFGSTWPPKSILVDQTFHLVILLILGHFLVGDYFNE